MVAAFTWRLRRMRLSKQTPTQRLGPQARAGRWLVNHVFESGTFVASFLLLHALYFVCQTPDCGIRVHKQTRCSGIPHSQESLSWCCQTHGGPGPPVTTKMCQATLFLTQNTTREGEQYGSSSGMQTVSRQNRMS